MNTNENIIYEAGKLLKEARKEKRVSLEYVARETRISCDKLKALEEDNYGYFASKFYARSFLKDYAKFLGADIDAATILPAGETHPIAPGVKLASSKIKNSEKRVFTKKQPLKFSKGFLITLALLAVPVLAAVLALNVPGFPIPGVSGHSAEVRVQEAPVAEQVDTAFEEKIILRAVARSSTWVRVTADGTTVYEGVMGPGSERQWESEDEMTIRIGLVSALDLYYRSSENEEFSPVDVREGSKGGINELSFQRGVIP